jgi:V/A-type H+/Na+-transporting ATPase subunit E
MSIVERTIREVCNEALDESLADLARGKTIAFDAVTRGTNETLLEIPKTSDSQRSSAEVLRTKIIDAAVLTARRKFLEAMDQNLSEAFSQAMANLEASAKTSPDYQGILKALVLEAVGRIGGADLVVQGNSRDQTILQVIASQIAEEREIRLSVDPQALSRSVGGVIVRSADGFVSFDNTYEARMERMKPRLRTEIARLFTEGPALEHQDETP